MKKILLLSLVLFLPACYNITFDSFEYEHYVLLKQNSDAAIPLCGTDAAQSTISSLKNEVDHQALYSGNRSIRPQIASASLQLKEIVDGLYTKYQTGNPSAMYCNEKLQNLSDGTAKIITELGKF